MRYRPDLPLVIDELCLRIEPREKLGICGRTGAGKSSILNCLLRIVEPSNGTTVIDGIDISGLGLTRLRRSISIIPQDPVLFSGSLRFNLDPLEERSNDEVEVALRRSHLSAHIDSLVSSGEDPARGNGQSSRLDIVVAEN